MLKVGLKIGLVSQEIFHCSESELGSIRGAFVFNLRQQAKQLAFKRQFSLQDFGNVRSFHVRQPFIFLPHS